MHPTYLHLWTLVKQ